MDSSQAWVDCAADQLALTLADPVVRAELEVIWQGLRRRNPMDPSVIFAWIIVVLAGAACVGALVFVIVWEVCAIRRTLAAHRRQVEPPGTYWRNHATVSIPERRP
jgi:hypothetical protein